MLSTTNELLETGGSGTFTMQMPFLSHNSLIAMKGWK